MTLAPDTQRTFGSRFAMTGEAIATPLYDELDAQDVERGVTCALWVVRPSLYPGPATRARLAEGVARARQVVHPAVRRLYAAGDAPGPWVSLQPGRRVPVGPVTASELVARIDAVVGALGALHGAGLLHGGVLAADLAIVDGELRLGGGGVWASADPGAMAAQAAAWIAPERRGGGRASAVADAWALAALVAGWVGGPVDAAAVVARRHPRLAAALAPFLVDDPVRRAHDLAAFAAAARGCLAEPFRDDVAAPSVAPGAARGRRRPRTSEEATEVGHAGGWTAPPAAASPEPAPAVGPAPGMVAVSMKPFDGRVVSAPTPPAPTPQLPRPNLRAPTGDPGVSLGRLAPPRAVVEAARSRSRRTWLYALVALLAAIVVVLAILVARG